MFTLVSQKVIYVPVPTWGNHHKVFGFGGLEVETYRYYDPKTRGLDYEGELGFESRKILYSNEESQYVKNLRLGV